MSLPVASQPAFVIILFLAYHSIGNPDQEQRARITHAAFNLILKLAPVCCRTSKLVCDKNLSPIFYKVAVLRFGLFLLAAGGSDLKFFPQIIEIQNTIIQCTIVDNLCDLILK